MAKKQKSEFYTKVVKLIKVNTPLDTIKETALDYGLTEEEFTEWMKVYPRSKAVSVASIASKDELESVYRTLDAKFLNENKDLVIYKRGENLDFYKYTNGYYQQVTDSEMYSLVDGMMCNLGLLDHRTSSKKVKDTIVRISATLTRTPHKSFDDDKKDRQKWMLNLKNGLLDMATFTLYPHTPEYFSEAQIPFNYDPNATCPKFENFIKTVTCNKEDNARMIKQMFGYCISYGNPAHKVFYMFGPTARNGKSTTGKILCGLIGEGNYSILSLQQIAGEKTSVLGGIVGKQLNFTDESPGKYLESSRFMSMIGEGMVDIDPKYKKAYKYQVRAKFIIACNDLPRFDEAQGMKHRMIAIPFNYQIPESERIDNYERVLLQEEGSGILNWAIAGYHDYKKDKVFFNSEESKEVFHENVLSSFPVLAFITEKYMFSDEYTEEILTSDMYGGTNDGYKKYCADNGISACSMQKFAKELNRFADEQKKIKKGVFTKYRMNGYTGLKLKTEIQLEEIFDTK